jgi:urea transport system ATP-binding protein
VSFDGFKAVDDLKLLRRQGRDPRHHRPERRRQDHGARPDLRAHQGVSAGSDRFKGKELLTMRETRSCTPGVGRKFQNPSIYEDLTVFENLESQLYPKGWSVFGALFFKRSEEVSERVEEVADTDLPRRSC